MNSFTASQPAIWLRFLIIAALTLGIFFRFFNLDLKPYWYDEAFTSLRISGYTVKELVTQFSKEDLISNGDFKAYQHISSEKSIVDTIKGLAVEEPQLTPIYFVMVRYWAQWFGSSVTAIRSLNVFISLLALPFIYWLCLELFESSLVGWIAVALIAISPFQVLYAQEARPYILWSVLTVVSSSSLLRAMRLKQAASWVVYTVTVVLGLYSFLYFALVVTSHLLYVLIIKQFQWRHKEVISFSIAAAVGFLTFIPWIWIFLGNINSAGRHLGKNSEGSLLFLVKSWFVNISRDFIDLGVEFNTDIAKDWLLFTPVILITLALVLYSVFFLIQNAPKPASLFILTLMAVTALVLLVQDLVFGGGRGTISRYAVPCHLGIELTIAHLLATQITSISMKVWQRKLGKIILLGLVSARILSLTIHSQSENWWHKELGSQNLSIAPIVNQLNHPILVAEVSRPTIGDALSLSHLLKPDVTFQFLVKSRLPDTPRDFSEIFLYGRPSKDFLNGFEDKKIRIDPIYREPDSKRIWLWKLVLTTETLSD